MALREIKPSEIKDLQRLGHKVLFKDGVAYTDAPISVQPKREVDVLAKLKALEARVTALEAARRP